MKNIFLIAVLLLQVIAFANIGFVPDPYYMQFYTIEDDTELYMTFKKYSKDYIKTNLNKEQRKIYKKCKKYDKWISKGWTYKVLNTEIEYLPAWIYNYNYYVGKKNKTLERVQQLEAIERINNKCNIFDKRAVKYRLAFAYYDDNDYQKAIKYLKDVCDGNKNSACAYYIGSSNLRLGNNDEAIKYANLITNNDGYDYEKLELLFIAYKKKKNNEKAHYYALKLLEKNPNDYINLTRVANSTNDKNKKLKYFYKAKNVAANNKDKMYCNIEIAFLEDEKTRNIAKKVKGYIVIPQWENIFNKDSKYMSDSYLDSRQTEFFKAIHNCTNNYYGNDLKACFNVVNTEQEKISQALEADARFRQQQALEMQRINQIQMMNYNLMEANYLQRQQNYILNKPRYTNSTTTKYGNTYYTNSYTY